MAAVIEKEHRARFGFWHTFIAEVRYDQEWGGWWVEFPNLPGCHTDGRSLDEVYRNVREAVECHLEDNPNAPEHYNIEMRIVA